MPSPSVHSLVFISVIGLLAAACGSDSADTGAQSAATSATSGPAQSGATPATPSPLPVGPANRAPQISGNAPGNAVAGRFWTYAPAISDPDGDTLTVTASNLPGWISVDSSTGRLSGEPSDADIREWSGFSITVSDGQASATLANLSVTVVAEATGQGSVTLSWLAPTQQVDGTPIESLSGYVVVYGQQPRDYTEVVVVDNPGLTTYMIEGLTEGDWYFAVLTVDGDGVVSDPSVEAKATI